MQGRAQSIARISVCLVVLFLAEATAGAQYFGRNKVQFRTFDFQVLRTEHFDIHFYPAARENAERVGRMSERWYARLSQLFEHELSSRQPIVLYASHPDFEQTNVIGGLIDEGTGGVTEGLKRRVVLPLTGTISETDHVLGHELVHAFQYDISASTPGGGPGGGISRLPLWLVEGMAEYFSIGPVDPHTAMWLRDAMRREALPRIKDLDRGTFFPYRWGQAVLAYIGGTYGDRTVVDVYYDALRTGAPIPSIVDATGVGEEELSAAWHAEINRQFEPVVRDAVRARSIGRRLSTGDERGTATNVSPSISPDGRYVVYFSSRNLFSMDLYLAETATGRIVRKLVDTTFDQHYTSLQFINSAGSWSADSRQFVLGAVRDGRAVLSILDVENADVVREIDVPEVGEIVNPAWSPDGRTIAFSANVGGSSDLFTYDLDASALNRLTEDAYADLQPAWSPDGRRLAFVTDRFTTDLETLSGGEYRLAVLDIETGRPTQVATFDVGKSINPQWNADGTRLFFVSDRSGISNVYTVGVGSGAVSQVTTLASGASGITALSPAISSASGAHRLVVSVYEDDGYHIYLIDQPERLAGNQPSASTPASRLQAATLPPVQRDMSLMRMLADPATGLPDSPGEVTPYNAGLSLDFVTQPYVSAGIDRFGTSVGGGIAFRFSDMLGNHNLFAQISADTFGSGLSDLAQNTGAVLAYTNLTRRWNWGVVLEQSPNIAGGYVAGETLVNGEPAFIDQTILQRQVNRGISGILAYPFSRATRLEFGGGFTRASFEEEIQTLAVSQVTGEVLIDESETNSLADPLSFSSVNAALVNDTSIFGATSPVAGSRSRFEVSPTFGDLRMTSALADYRHYFMPAPFYTIAFRGFHFGRYGDGGEDPRLVPLFLGYPQFVRGYGSGSFDVGECAPSQPCPTFDRLVGSRMMVGNVEFRFPLLRPFVGPSAQMYGPLPVEVAFFLDSGVAWNRGEKPFEGLREAVASGGITLRMNLFGFAVTQLDFARPFDRPGRGWVWAFSFTPGF